MEVGEPRGAALSYSEDLGPEMLQDQRMSDRLRQVAAFRKMSAEDPEVYTCTW